MKKFIFLIIFLFLNPINGQNFNPAIVALSENPNIEDFDFLKKELEGVQVVMLGESSHYDGNVFEMKTKIVKFLHQEMGFNTIAFESGIYDVWKAQKEIESGMNTKEAFVNSLFSIWSKSNEFQSFIDFYDKNKTELKLFGFDYQFTGNNNFNKLSEDLFEYSKKIKFKLKLNQEDFELLLESLTISGMFDEEDISYNQFKSSLSELYNQIKRQKDSEEKFYWTQIVKSILELGNDAISNKDVLSTFNVSVADNDRDKQMADNLLEYLKQNPKAKIICWGANVHFVNNTTSIKTPILKDFVPMGSYVKSELNEKAYSLASVTASDSIFLQNKWHKTPIEAESFEGYLKKKDIPHIFISSNQTEMKKVLLNRLFSPITFVESNINELHDGYLFFKNTTQSTTIEDEISINRKRYIPEQAHKQKVSEYKLLENPIQIEEIIISGKRTPYSIIKQVIDSLDSNYPKNSFSSQLNTNIITKVSNNTILDFDFIADQYDLSYVHHTNRSVKSLRKVNWNMSDEFRPESLREYHGLVYNNPIQYVQILKKGKFKKFHFVLEETKIYNGEEIYVISFSSPRKHSSYTRRVYLSDYSGYLYINVKDFAVVKIFENWKVTDFPDSFRQGYNFKNTLSKYTAKEYLNESTTTEFSKLNNSYFITYSENIIFGEIYNIHGDREKFTTFVESEWSDFNLLNPKKIKNKDEEHLFNKISN